MARVEVTVRAREEIRRLIRTHSLPETTNERVRRVLEPLAEFPELGATLSGRWSRFRFVLGPWRWMILVYAYDAGRDRVTVLTAQDSRSAQSPTSSAGEMRDSVRLEAEDDEAYYGVGETWDADEPR